jgi:UDP-N-acetylmuramoyl-tripeptide--D-alanyl-D-alanine ligase
MTKSHPIPWSAEEMLQAIRGKFMCGDLHRRFMKASIDSRKISQDDFFVAIIGEVHDGHSFAANVVDQGVRGLIINRNKAEQLPIKTWEKKEVTCIAVEDTTRALGDLAAFHRNRTNVSVIAITGSNGKTTTRQLITAVAAQKYRTLATIGNFNNQIGLPLTLLNLEPDHQWAVVELGTNNPGEIARLSQICSPNVAVITNIGPAHLEGLGSIDGVMREKGDLLANLRPSGKAVLNADDPRVMQLAQRTKNDVLLFGVSDEATIRAEAIMEKDQELSFTLVLAEERLSIELTTPGQFMVSNALAAAAVGFLLGVSPAKIKTGLKEFKPVPGRMNILKLSNGINIIDDTYNANPDSMKAAIETLKTLSAANREILVVGDMLELGTQAKWLHKKIGAVAARSGIKRLYACGEFATTVAAGAQDEGMQSVNTITGTREEIGESLRGWLQPGDWVLIKGSRGMAMEKIVQELKDWGGTWEAAPKNNQ